MNRRPSDILTPREREVLDLIRRGLTNEEIAQRLGISLDGAKYHVSQILSKLGVASREDAAVWRPKERSWYWKLAWLGVAAATTAAVLAAIAVGLPNGGKTITTESGVSANDALARAKPPAIARAPSKANPEETPTPAGGTSPTPTPSLVVVDPTTIDVSDLPTPGEPTSTPTETPGATVTATATPTSCEASCSGIQGIVVEAVCPVETSPPQPECYPGYKATIIIWNADHSQQVMQFGTDERGYFKVPLSPGDYYVDPQTSGMPSPPDPFLVSVPPAGFRQLKIVYDSHIY